MVKRKRNILFIVNGLSIGGGEAKLLELVQGIQNQYSDDFNCIVCSVGMGGPLQKSFEALNVKLRIYPKKNAHDLSLVYKVARLIREEQIDIIQTTLFYADVIGAYAAWLTGVRNVISWEAVTQPYSLKHMMAYRLAAKWFAVSVAVSNAIRDEVMQKRHVGLEKTQTIHYGVDLEAYHPAKNHILHELLGLNSDVCIVSTVARLTPQKGHVYLIPALPDIVKAYPQAHFVFIGDGPLRNSLETQCRELEITEHVHFLGFRDDVAALLQSSDLFVLPSLYEGLPNVVLEAMACGLPVIATAVDGTPEAVVEGETGFLVEPKDPEALKTALMALINNRGLRQEMGMKSRTRVEQYFSLERQIKEFIALYDKLSP